MKMFRRLMGISRQRKIGISTGILLATVSGPTCWLLPEVWVHERIIIQEPRFPVIVTEVISIGLISAFGLASAFYFWKYGK